LIKDDIFKAEVCSLKYPLYNSGSLRLYIFWAFDKLVIVSGLCGAWKIKGLKADGIFWIKKFEQAGQVSGCPVLCNVFVVEGKWQKKTGRIL